MSTLAQVSTAFPHEDVHNEGDPMSAQYGSPLNPGWTLLGGMGAEKKLKADGQPPKRRGPKPDSKPAMTRRQELNRQAQRTHRERKEHYVKAIEVELSQLKGLYSRVAKERNTLKREVQHLQEILAFHGIDPSTGAANFSNQKSTSGSFSGSYQLPTSPDDSLSPQPLSGGGMQHINQLNHHQTIGNKGDVMPSVEYNQAGIDFVLALERPCMDHIGFLVDRSSSSDGEISGHARMMTCPPHTNMPDGGIAIGHAAAAGGNHGIASNGGIAVGAAEMPDGLDTPDLSKLLDLSNRLPLNGDGEVTPIMAWHVIMTHEEAFRFDYKDILALRSVLLPKIRCYGFGAVLEEFEVGDAIVAVLAAKSEASLTSV